MATDIAKALTQGEAQELTTRIKANVESLWYLLTEAKERRAWDALGYTSWGEYVRVEFDMTRAYAYRILHQGKVINELTEAAGMLPIGNTPSISEWRTRNITPEKLPQAVAEVRRAVERGVLPTEAIRETVSSFSEAHREAEKQVIASDALPDVRRVYEAITRMRQGWNAEDVGPAINSVYGAVDVGHVLDEVTKSAEYLSELVRCLRAYLERE